MKIADLYKPQTLPAGANIDARYWTDNGDGTYTPTPLLVYNIARDATEYFKKKIVAMDKEEPATVCYGERPIKLGEYHYRDCNVTIVDDYENRMLSREYEIKYAEQTKEVNRRWKEYQKAHPDEFNITLNVQSPALGDHDENAYFNGFHTSLAVPFHRLARIYALFNTIFYLPNHSFYRYIYKYFQGLQNRLILW